MSEPTQPNNCDRCGKPKCPERSVLCGRDGGHDRRFCHGDCQKEPTCKTCQGNKYIYESQHHRHCWKDDIFCQLNCPVKVKVDCPDCPKEPAEGTEGNRERAEKIIESWKLKLSAERWEWFTVDLGAALDAAERRGYERRKEKETRICAAIRMSNGTVVGAWRHTNTFEAVRGILELAGVKEPTKESMRREIGKAEQGFITTKGRFVSREDGRRLQDEAGIESACQFDGGYRGRTLFSEDLY